MLFKNNNRGSNQNNKNDNSILGNWCRKYGCIYDWKDCPENEFGNNYQENKSNTNKQRTRDSSREIEFLYEDQHEVNLMKIDYDISDNKVSVLGLIGRYDSES